VKRIIAAGHLSLIFPEPAHTLRTENSFYLLIMNFPVSLLRVPCPWCCEQISPVGIPFENQGAENRDDPAPFSSGDNSQNFPSFKNVESVVFSTFECPPAAVLPPFSRIVEDFWILFLLDWGCEMSSLIPLSQEFPLVRRRD